MSGMLARRKILLIVTGGIAAYKTCELIRLALKAEAEVQVAMTDSAAEFIGPLTFATLSGGPVLQSLFPQPPPSAPIHLAPGRWADILVVAPASANFIGKFACGIADDLPTNIAMGFAGPALIAPAMNPRMWSASAVQENIARLVARGVAFIGPEEGEMGGVGEESGMGRMTEPQQILDKIEELLADRTKWAGRMVVVTSGPTRESFDPVRYISNRSSGRMGDAIARAAFLRGADVRLIRGSGAAGEPPAGVDVDVVETAADMAAAVKRAFDDCDLLVMAAAVADWKPSSAVADKLKKGAGLPELSLTLTEDILAWAGKHRARQAVVGFALETADHEAEARLKLAAKNIDLIALNDPTEAHSAFGGDTIQLTLIPKSGNALRLPVLPKREAAVKLLDATEKFLPDR